MPNVIYGANARKDAKNKSFIKIGIDPKIVESRRQKINDMFLQILKRPATEDDLNQYKIEIINNPRKIKIDLMNSDEMLNMMTNYADQFKDINITVLALFRNNAGYVATFQAQFDLIEKSYPQTNFNYFIYENDSTDNTYQLLKNFMNGRKGQLQHEVLNTNMEIGKNLVRSNNMALYRNKLLNLARPFNSEWTIITDTNIFIRDYSILGYMLEFAQKHPDAAMLTVNGLLKNNIYPDHYYDTYALKYMGKQYEYCLSKNCKYHIEREQGEYDYQTEFVEVDSAFGGFIIVKSDILNKIKYKEDDYHVPECEHVYFCEQVKKFGKIYMLPRAIVYWIQ